MLFYSTKNKNDKVTLKDAVLQGMPIDKGLYMPEQIPQLPKHFFDGLSGLSLQEIGLEVSKSIIGNDIPLSDLKKIVEQSINFDAPLKQIKDKIFTLELFHGPTMAFKDFGARFMAKLMSYLIRNDNRKLTILVATSGDTGSAVGNGFYDVPGIDVIILYPLGRISKIQEMQIATLDKNITPIEIDGNFDDCQRLVKEAFVDAELRNYLRMTSANSINISRLIPQSFYYFYAISQLKKQFNKNVICVPSGNFGNLTGGLMAKQMGLKVDRFIAATNINSVVPEYLESGDYRPRKSIETISNAMDVGDPSNFQRMQDIYGDQYFEMTKEIEGYSFSDDLTREKIKQVYSEHSYLLDPHGAVGYLGIETYLEQHSASEVGIFLETAHPAKFIDVVEPVIGEKITIPNNLAKFLHREKTAFKLTSNFADFKKYLLTRN